MERKNTFTQINDMDLARQIIRKPQFGPVNLSDYLELLAVEGGFDFNELISFCKESLVFQSGQEHLNSRRLIGAFFSNKSVMKWDHTLIEITNELLDNPLEKVKMDLLHDFCDPMYVAILKQVLGLQIRNEGSFVAHVNEARYFTEPLQSVKKLLSIQESVKAIIEETEASFNADKLPEGSLIDYLRGLEVNDGQRRNHIMMVVSLIIAAHTTSETFAIILYELLKNRQALWLKAKSREWLDERVNGLIRLYPTTQFIGRKVTEDCKIGEYNFSKDEVVQIKVSVVNRDLRFISEASFLNGSPELKCPVDHMSFGGGAHKCPGAALSRLTFLEAIPILVQRLPGLTLMEDSIEWAKPFMVNIPTRLNCVLN